MKRCISMALVLALLTAAFPLHSLAEEAEIVSEFVETEVAPAEAAGDTGLTVEGEAPEAEPAPEAAEATQEPPAFEEAPDDYARISAAAVLYGDTDGAAPIAEIDAGSTVLVTEEGPLTGIALFTERGVIAGYVDAACLERMDAAATAAYMDAAAETAVALYEDDLSKPLVLCGCVFIDSPAAVQAEADAQIAEEAELALTAADNTEDAENTEDAGEATPKAATAIKLSLTAVSIGVGEKYEGLSATASPADSSLTEITWSSSDKTVAKVSSKTGKLTGVKAGECTVTAKTADGLKASCKVTVAKKPKKVSLSESELALSVDMKARLTASVPTGCASGKLTFESSKPSVVSVSEKGKLVALKKGSATITVTTYNGKTATCKVTVTKAPASLAFSADSLSIAPKQKVTLKTTAKTAAGDTTPASITFAIDETSPDAGCIKLDAATGSVKGVRKGQAIVTATTHNGLVARCTVSVDVAPKSVKTNLSSVSIGVGEKYDGLSAKLTPPSDSTTCATWIRWSSSNKKVAKVNATTGVITGVKAGSATITVTAAGGKTATCKVTVAKKPKKVSLSESKLTLTVGMKAALTASVPKGYASGKLTFESSKPKYVSVDGKGNLVALKKGSSTITVTTYNGKTATCKVTVKKAPASLTLSSEKISIAVDQKVVLKATAKSASGNSTPADITFAIDKSSPDAGCIKLYTSSATIKGVRKGQAIVTATTQNGIVARCTVTVDVAPKSVKVNQSSVSIGLNEKYKGLAAVLTPPSGSKTCATTVSWSSSDKSIVKVSASTGTITGMKKGTATITVKTPNGKTATCKVTVKKAPTGLTVKPENGALKVGQTGKYEVSQSPGDCAGHLTYKCSDETIADVDDEGYITALAPGKVTITVSTYNGISKKVSLEVNESSDDDGDVGSDQIAPSGNAKKLEYVITIALTQKGKPYVYGSGYSNDPNPRGFDCSGFVYWCYLHIGIRLKDSAYKQGYDDSLKKITDKDDLRRGDLLYFNTNHGDDDLSDHAALYLGDGKFIHASSSKGVIVSDMSVSGSYYDRVFSWGRRVLE